MPSREIPGFYYDEAKKKYFKILPNHIAPRGSHYSKDAVKKEIESKLLKMKADKYVLRRQQTQIQHSQILGHPLGGRISLQREVGVRDAHMRDSTTGWAQGLINKACIEPGVSITCFVRDDATGCLIYASPRPGLDAVVFALPTRNQGPAPYVHVPRIFLDSEISCLALSPSRVLMATTMGCSRAACVHLATLKPPEEVPNVALPDGQRPWPASWDITTDLSLTIRSQTGNTFWASAPRPHPTSSDFAIGTSAGTILVGQSQALYSFEPPQMFGSGNVECIEGHSEVLAVDWLDTNVILNGLRNGKVKLWDSRTKGLEGTSSRVQHPSLITYVRKVKDHKIAVAGLDHQLCIYDMRFLPPKAPVANVPTRPWLSFPSYHNQGFTGLAVGFDVCRNLIAAGSDRDTMQLFDAENGIELKMSPESELRKRQGAWPARCLRFVDGEETREGPRLFVAAGEVIDEWAW